MMKAKPVPTPVVNADAPMPRMVVGNIASAATPPAKTSGIKIRGTGAATKGRMARGPMA
jgi:hypothetical protein